MGLYRLQISQHQLQKDVTHQLSRFLVNRRDDEADLSDMVHIFLRSGFFSHGVLLSQMQNKIIALPVVHRGSKQASTLAGCWPVTYDLGTRRHKLRYATLGQNVPKSARFVAPPLPTKSCDFAGYPKSQGVFERRERRTRSCWPVIRQLIFNAALPHSG